MKCSFYHRPHPHAPKTRKWRISWNKHIISRVPVTWRFSTSRNHFISFIYWCRRHLSFDLMHVEQDGARDSRSKPESAYIPACSVSCWGTSLVPRPRGKRPIYPPPLPSSSSTLGNSAIRNDKEERNIIVRHVELVLAPNTIHAPQFSHSSSHFDTISISATRTSSSVNFSESLAHDEDLGQKRVSFEKNVLTDAPKMLSQEVSPNHPIYEKLSYAILDPKLRPAPKQPLSLYGRLA